MSIFSKYFWIILTDLLSFAQDEHIKAILKDGLLTVTFPESLPELAPKKIVIQTSDKEEYDTDFNLWFIFLMCLHI